MHEQVGKLFLGVGMSQLIGTLSSIIHIMLFQQAYTYNNTATVTVTAKESNLLSSSIMSDISDKTIWYIIGALVFFICYCLLTLIMFIWQTSEKTKELHRQFTIKMKEIEMERVNGSLNSTPTTDINDTNDTNHASMSPSDGKILNEIGIKNTRSHTGDSTLSLSLQINNARLTDSQTWAEQMLKLQIMHHSMMVKKTVPPNNAFPVSQQLNESTPQMHHLSSFENTNHAKQKSEISQLSAAAESYTQYTDYTANEQ